MPSHYACDTYPSDKSHSIRGPSTQVIYPSHKAHSIRGSSSQVIYPSYKAHSIRGSSSQVIYLSHKSHSIRGKGAQVTYTPLINRTLKEAQSTKSSKSPFFKTHKSLKHYSSQI